MDERDPRAKARARSTASQGALRAARKECAIGF
jgi:hypothetical protein